ncbi:MAG: class I SAM-dependent methyltransferase [Myxococcales bacterium]|nr:class I SAM-dependent methyltransferase [Myxococcales bacterium]
MPVASAAGGRGAAEGGASQSDGLYVEPRYYRMLFDGRTHDVELYAAVCGRGRVLELGVGTGRVALPLARAGAEVVGVDLSPEMLAEFAAALERESGEVRARVRTHCADVRELDLGERFPFVICPFNGLAHHHGPAALAAFFASVRRHLAPGGAFAFDVMLPEPQLLLGQSSTVPWLRHPRTGEVCRCDEEIRYDPFEQILTIRTTLSPRAGGDVQRLELRLRQFFPQETRLMLAHHGFVVERCETALGDAVGYVCRARESGA